MKLRITASIIIFLSIYGGISAYIGWNGWLFLSEISGLEQSATYTILIIILALAYLIGRATQSTWLRPIAELLKLIGSYWFAIVQFGVLLLPVANITALLLKWAGVSKEIYLIGVGGAVLLLLLGILLLGSRNAWSPVIRHYEATIAKSAGNRDSLRIAMASDLHLGTVIDNNHIDRLVAKVNEIKPDIILLPGDILDDDLTPFLQKGMSAKLGQLKAPLGVFAVTGNHEYIGKKVPEFVKTLEAIGIRVLMDETVVIDDSFIIIGRKDKAAASFGVNGRKSIVDLLAPLDTTLPLIMLDHQPSDIIVASDNGIDLSLSGHTHRGQMMPNHLITKRIFPLDFGYKRIKNLNAFVSSGFGFWGPPIRIGSRSEVLHIEVKFDASK
ncbi:metallophosphoesterase [Paenibacillus sp. GSMTC-2017]|uniref:metallophosphoesterase n=1 Tax=Paenibacillus sp. GSMTC-2017 TaxID=2794350 RepID=UPI0018D7FE3A|nr:metallophosphoesterase [Paenibacillus sp. GSMTC-2017]MBH5319225.1 metallophosphoesterase [Paenibacillus sp. GSMTC-2017]